METVMGIDEFEVTRVHGMNALRGLSAAYRTWLELGEWKERPASETWEEKYQSADSTGARVRGLGSILFSHLSATVVLYQASMEAIISNAVSMDDAVRKVATGKSFSNDWQAALKALNQPDREFLKYKNEFYKEFRIPLTHLHPDAEKKLEKVRSIDFEAVYNGVRFGWWAHVRLLIGLRLAPNNIHDNWAYICSGVGLPPGLFPGSHPDELGECGPSPTNN